jgi:hypothetical protein
VKLNIKTFNEKLKNELLGGEFFPTRFIGPTSKRPALA